MRKEDYKKILDKACELFVDLDCCPPEDWSSCSGSISVIASEESERCEKCWRGYLIVETRGKICGNCKHRFKLGRGGPCSNCGWTEELGYQNWELEDKND